MTKQGSVAARHHLSLTTEEHSRPNAARFITCLAIGCALLFLAACGDREPGAAMTESGITTAASSTVRAPAESPTSTLSPSPSATPDAKATAADEAYSRIVEMQAKAALVRYALGRMAGDGDWAQQAASLDGTCKSTPGRPYSFLADDLWPRPYVELDLTLAASCKLFADQVTKLGQPSPSNRDWQAFVEVHHAALADAFAALPDYSEAQLRRAIADRQ